VIVAILVLVAGALLFWRTVHGRRRPGRGITPRMGTVVNDLAIEGYFVATAGQTVFGMNCRIFPNNLDDFVVTRNGNAVAYNAAASTVAQYKVTPTPLGGEGGQIIFGAGLTAGDVIYIRRQLPLERTVQLAETGPLDIPGLNDQLAYLTALIQDMYALSGGRDSVSHQVIPCPQNVWTRIINSRCCHSVMRSSAGGSCTLVYEAAQLLVMPASPSGIFTLGVPGGGQIEFREATTFDGVECRPKNVTVSVSITSVHAQRF
jgi:hypothetical protein